MRTILGIFMVICLAASTTACGGKCDKLKSKAKAAGCLDETKMASADAATIEKCAGIFQSAMKAKCK